MKSEYPEQQLCKGTWLWSGLKGGEKETAKDDPVCAKGRGYGVG